MFIYQPVYLQIDWLIYKWTGSIYELSEIHASTRTLTASGYLASFGRKQGGKWLRGNDGIAVRDGFYGQCKCCSSMYTQSYVRADENTLAKCHVVECPMNASCFPSTSTKSAPQYLGQRHISSAT